MTNIVQAIIAEADVPNKNNRVYPKEVLQTIVEKFTDKTSVTLGQLGMNMPNGIMISLETVSHVVESLELVDDNKVRAIIKVLDTPQGKILQDLISTGAVEFRLAGMGSLEEQGGSFVVGDDYSLLTVNAVLKEEAA